MFSDYTMCPRSIDPCYIVTFNIKCVTTSWTYSISFYISFIYRYSHLYWLQIPLIRREAGFPKICPKTWPKIRVVDPDPGVLVGSVFSSLGIKSGSTFLNNSRIRKCDTYDKVKTFILRFYLRNGSGFFAGRIRIRSPA